ncbi:MAG: class I SAM-dependent methyltransferase [Ignavibacteria bacterium]|nr:class I SAM-dependent methyltransferase [Ignavibacteria bacterium]
MFRKLLDNRRPDSLANWFRRVRFRHFTEITDKLPKPVSVIDLGGTENFWIQMGIAGNKNYNITLININGEKSSYDNIFLIKADALELEVKYISKFDLIFSNSLIEHVGDFSKQKSLADIILSSGKPFFIQTPNYYFPFEPHFLFPGFQFLPLSLKKFLVKNFRMGWFNKCSSDEEAEKLVKSIRLLKKSEIIELFPNSSLIKEKFLLLTKSFIVINTN